MICDLSLTFKFYKKNINRRGTGLSDFIIILQYKDIGALFIK